MAGTSPDMTATDRIERCSRFHDHALHHPVRRRRLRHAAVRAGLRAGGDAGADELRQPRAWRVRHGRRLCLRGAGQPITAGRSSPRCRWRLSSSAAIGVVLERLALPPSLHPQPSRPGAVHRRPRLHVGGGGRLHHGLVADLHQAAGGAGRAVRFLRRRHRPLPADDHRDLRPADRGAATDPGAHAVRQPAARGGGRSARRQSGSASTCRRCSPSPLRSAAALPGSAAR